MSQGNQPATPRRAVVRGAAWSVPAVAVAAAAPAIASSPVAQAPERALWARRDDPGNGCNTYSVSTYRTTTTTNSTAVYIRWANTTTQTRISDVSVTFYFPFSNMTWEERSPGNHTCWTLLERDTTKPDRAHPTTGRTLYAYTTPYTCPITTVNGTTLLPDLDFRTAACYQSTSTWRSDWGYQIDFTFNGLVGVSGPIFGHLS